MNFFLNPEAAERFRKIDPSILREKYKMVVIAPPGFEQVREIESTPDWEAPDATFECNCLCEDGTLCGKRFVTSAALCIHMARAVGGTRGRQLLTRRLPWANQCVVCLSVVRSRDVAEKHMKQALLLKNT